MPHDPSDFTRDSMRSPRLGGVAAFALLGRAYRDAHHTRYPQKPSALRRALKALFGRR